MTWNRKQKPSLTIRKWGVSLVLVMSALAGVQSTDVGAARQTPPPSMHLTAQAEGINTVGHEIPDTPGPLTKPFQVPAGRRVMLASKVDLSSAPGNTQLSYNWRQLSGPAVEWRTPPDSRSTAAPISRIEFRAKNPGVYRFDCRVMVLDATGVPTGVEIRKRIQVQIVKDSR